MQWMLADCASELYISRLMLMHIAYKAEKGIDLRQENSIAKVYLANMVHKVVDTAIQLHGALGYSQDTPLARWYTSIRSQRLVDGPDEVHKLDRRPQPHQGLQGERHNRRRLRRRLHLTHPRTQRPPVYPAAAAIGISSRGRVPAFPSR